ncbi:hypothetical protein KBB96_07560 [Luteolibacter ambystomatis]|uniref:Uncharacterized protein n=1 Tax=Luteolibacter ambystomatis TaxID=2824561 RepID=A0A975J2A9_9BACT|nr:hypothetical protein [Luteolibacter ambystomatis]QUE52740.1 hypothetical protein KBB96_07560 [Luteolibacter ambystomatis]
MRKYLVLAWLLLPLPVVVMHFGRGQEWLARDKAHSIIQRAEAAEKKGEWQSAYELYREADRTAGSQDRQLKLRLDLARARTGFRVGEAVASIDGMDKLLDDAATATMPAEFQQETHELAARLHYYAGWVMRLEGAKRELWMEEAELARQNFRLLSEHYSDPKNEDQTHRQKEDLESAVQLQRLSLTELMARPLPEEGRAMSGQGLSEQMGKRRGQRGKQPGRGPNDKGPPAPGGGMRRFQPGSGS